VAIRRSGPSGRYLTEAEESEILRRVRAGENSLSIAQAVGRPRRLVYVVLKRSGGFSPRARTRSPLRLSLAEREEISRGLRSGSSCRAIARGLHRAPSSVSREVRRCGGGPHYRAWAADAAALELARRPKRTKLATSPRLRAAVSRLLLLEWSPQQISRRLVREYPTEEAMRVSAETIYRALYVQTRGSLRKELHRHLRTQRQRRHPKLRTAALGIHDMVPISERPAEASDRAVPGHWEGDLLLGTGGHSAIGTLVERRTRYTMLFRLAAGRSAPAVRDALTKRIQTLPAQLRRSLTWDQGKEMAEHVRFSVESGVQVYFCDPRSPWQRGSNENTNGLLRQYFPKTFDLSNTTQAQLDAVARRLNGRPRHTLDWKTPAEALAEVVR